MDDLDGANPPMLIQQGSVDDPVAVVAPPSDGLTDLQRRFCEAFVLNGGRSTAAALEAGYGEGGAENMGIRNLARGKVQAEIVRRVKLQSGSALAIAIGGLLRVIETSKDDKAVVQAALGLADRFGLAAPKGPAVAVQVNMNGSTAQTIIKEVHEMRQARLVQQDDS